MAQSKRIQNLKKIASQLPSSPGVYLMKDVKGKIIYVGKAKSLKSRVSTYFQAQTNLDFKTQALVKLIWDLEVILVETEKESFLVERSLIKHNKPKFNIRLMDDKEYPFIRIHLKDEWPRFTKVRRRKDDGATYLGPFSNAGKLRSTLDLMYQIFPLIRCTPYVFKTVKRPCNYYQIKMCLAPCCLPVDKEHYSTLVKEAIQFLKGNNKEIIKQVKNRMFAEAEKENFERAAQLRDVLTAVENVQQRQGVVTNIKSADVIYFYQDLKKHADHVAIAILQVRDRLIVSQETYGLLVPVGEVVDAASSFLIQYYENRYVPPLIITNQEFNNDQMKLNEVLESDEKNTQVQIFTPQKGEKKQLLDLAEQNAKYYFSSNIDEMERRNANLEAVQNLLKLTELPKRIECIDISNLGETNTVASNVCFIDGKPAKELYRLYNIKNNDNQQNDFAAIAEVVERRIRRGLKEDDFPELLIVDGGKGQLSAAMEVYKIFDSQVPPDFQIVGLAKSRVLHNVDSSVKESLHSDERVFLPGKDTPLILETGSPSYRIFTQIRDEAHRFAISFHRKKRSQSTYKSELDDIPGIGPALHKKLLQRFQSIESIKRASMDELQSIKGISEGLAIKIKAKLDNQ